jgi:hypothetical protein
MQQEAHTDLRLKSYLLEQGHRLLVLDDILFSGGWSHHARVWSSVLLETLLYVLSVTGIIAIISLPVIVQTELEFLGLDHQFAFVAFAQIAIGVFIAPATALAYLLRKNRKKKMRLRQAYIEITKMREAHDRIVTNMN